MLATKLLVFDGLEYLFAKVMNRSEAENRSIKRKLPLGLTEGFYNHKCGGTPEAVVCHDWWHYSLGNMRPSFHPCMFKLLAKRDSNRPTAHSTQMYAKRQARKIHINDSFFLPAVISTSHWIVPLGPIEMTEIVPIMAKSKPSGLSNRSVRC